MKIGEPLYAIIDPTTREVCWANDGLCLTTAEPTDQDERDAASHECIRRVTVRRVAIVPIWEYRSSERLNRSLRIARVSAVLLLILLAISILL